MSDSSSTGKTRDARILIIRHGEKPPDKSPDLTADGRKRAQRYVAYFGSLAVDGKRISLGRYSLVAAARSKHSNRCVETVTPLEEALHVAHNHGIPDESYQLLANQVLAGDWNGRTTLVCWHHGQIPNLLKALGVPVQKFFPDQKWPDNVFCWMFELRYDATGALTISLVNVNLMPDDKNFPVPVVPT